MRTSILLLAVVLGLAAIVGVVGHQSSLKSKLMAPKKDTPCEEACYAAAATCDKDCGEPCQPGSIACQECVYDCSSNQQDCINGCPKKSTKQMTEQEYQSEFTAFVKQYNKKSVRTGGRRQAAGRQRRHARVNHLTRHQATNCT
jgi:hypothetical protein